MYGGVLLYAESRSQADGKVVMMARLKMVSFWLTDLRRVFWKDRLSLGVSVSLTGFSADLATRSELPFSPLLMYCEVGEISRSSDSIRIHKHFLQFNKLLNIYILRFSHFHSRGYFMRRYEVLPHCFEVPRSFQIHQVL